MLVSRPEFGPSHITRNASKRYLFTNVVDTIDGARFKRHRFKRGMASGSNY